MPWKLTLVLVREEAAPRAFGSQGMLSGTLTFGFDRLRFRLPAGPAQGTESDAVSFVFLEEGRRAMGKKREEWGKLYYVLSWCRRGAQVVLMDLRV